MYNKFAACWQAICSNQQLSENFIREFADKVDWVIVPMSVQLSEPFIEEFKDRLDMKMVSENARRI